MELTEVLNDAYTLADKIRESSLYFAYVESLEEIKNNQNLQKLIKQFKKSQEKYSYNKTLENLTKLQTVKQRIDRNRTINRYNKVYKEISLYLYKIKNTIIEDIFINDDIYLAYEASKDASLK